MSSRIEKKDGYFEVALWGESNKWEVIQAVGELRLLNPGKQWPDLWVISPEVTIPYYDYADIVSKVMEFIPGDITLTRSAILTNNEMQMVLADMYRADAAYPYEMKVFTNRDEATAWLMGGTDVLD